MKSAGIALMASMALLVALMLCRSRPLERGLAGDLFISTARPALALVPDKNFKASAGWVADVTPESERGNPQVRVWLALYHDAKAAADPIPASGSPLPGKAARLVALLAEVDVGGMAWSMDMRPPFSPVREYQEEIGPFAMQEATYVLPPGPHPADARLPADPFDAFFGDAPADWQRGSLVRRYTGLVLARSRKMIIEYREPLPQNFDAAAIRDIQNLLAPEYLLAFEHRARASFALSDDPAAILRQSARTVKKPVYPPKAFSRRSQALMLGMLRASGD